MDGCEARSIHVGVLPGALSLGARGGLSQWGLATPCRLGGAPKIGALGAIPYHGAGARAFRSGAATEYGEPDGVEPSLETQALELRCQACGKRFRITPQRARVPGRTFACTRCQSPVEVPEFDHRQGWRRLRSEDIFGSSPPNPRRHAPSPESTEPARHRERPRPTPPRFAFQRIELGAADAVEQPVPPVEAARVRPPRSEGEPEPDAAPEAGVESGDGVGDEASAPAPDPEDALALDVGELLGVAHDIRRQRAREAAVIDADFQPHQPPEAERAPETSHEERSPPPEEEEAPRAQRPAPEERALALSDEPAETSQEAGASQDELSPPDPTAPSAAPERSSAGGGAPDPGELAEDSAPGIRPAEAPSVEELSPVEAPSLAEALPPVEAPSIQEEVPTVEASAQVAAPEREPQPEAPVAPSGGWRWWRVGLLVVGLVAAFVLGALAPGWLGWGEEEEEAGPAPVEVAPAREMISLDARLARVEAVGTASLLVHLAAREDGRDPTRRRAVARELLEHGEATRARRLLGWMWEHGQRTPGSAELYARAFLELERYDEARRIALEGLTQDAAHEPLQDLYNEAVAEDPALHPETRTLEADDQIDEIRALGGGKSISLKLRRDGETRWAFKPSQFEWSEGWRAEVAAYLMCEAMPCGFEVPRSLPARISRADFEALYARHNSEYQREYEARFEALEWVEEPGPDGVEREYLYGVIKDWVPGFVDWPIEYTDLWQPWLDASRDPSLMEVPPTQALWALRQRQGGKYWRAWRREGAQMSTRELARGISNLLVFDFVTSNWDRFSSVERFYGVNNQLDEGRFLSLDNGAAFHIQSMQRVRERFELASRFDIRLITALRVVEPSALDPVLFPDPSAEGRTRLEVFWAQRDALIERVDALVAEHGAEAVLAFGRTDR